ncbi:MULTISPECIES: efflux RND transporter permease subunit [Idiomarina]|uniref:Efflux RND transporter permease subunit n=9 Tax=Idiomarina TaxID=135575 RepID=A0A8I1G748_9GAMM|nr:MULTISPECIES: efflux RND transporter permease subunit [Idiomarina]KPD20803.1 multidrug transporter AcrB [Idiomarina abyssalis]MAO67369.1 AcrB/AcrD/AcrF family protein [Idiomarina sp.]MBF80446.1 AcrB/AcrD/AcrF family protein [Idiomarina sp.]MBJ7266384.1 efflux RND transporter permease subunit [Idiomarina abyssalis]MBJ7272368.1 efflux RND transporter permease subunit [Idiomarina abyssalis]|tara:strand:- start:11623 stop:14730 length:3108 start_codon:yes stop_codon:yes gene_type:complete
MSDQQINNQQDANDLPSVSIRRPVLIVVLNVLIAIAGIAALMGVEVRELPDVDRPVVGVSATLPGGAPETVDAEVTSILEGAAARVSGVESIRSSSEENSARISIEFRPGVDLDVVAAEVREAVNQIRRELPDDVEQINVRKADNDARSVLDIAVSSDSLTLEELTRRLETDLSPEFLAINGVADVRLNGDRERVLRVDLDPLKLVSFGLSVTDVADALRQAPFDVPAGSLRSTDQRLIIRADATAITEEQVENIIVRDDTRVGDVAQAYFAPADANSFVRLDGKPVVGLGVIRQAGSNTIEISDKALAVLERLRERFPDMEMSITNDDAQFIRKSVAEVVTTLAITIALVVATLWVFIGSFRATIIPAFSIPVALFGAVAAIWLMGFSINILTLLALVLATGLIVDDAIVVTENIQRRRSMGLGSRAAAVLGTREVFFAVVATTAVLVAVFVPIAFLPSTAGRLFREFGGVLAAAVVISSFVALSLVPAFTARLPKSAGQSNRFAKIGNVFKRFYKRTLHKALDFSWVIVILSLLSAGGGALLYNQINSELMPNEDRGSVRVFSRGPDGVGLKFMDRQARKLEEILLEYKESGDIESIYTVVGQWDPNLVFITANLKPWEERDISQQEIINNIREPLSQVPGAPGRAFGDNSLNLRGQGGGLEMAITGENYDEIFRAAREFTAVIKERMPELGEPNVSYQPTQPQLRVKIDRRRAAELGVSLSDISSTLRAAINGDDVADLNVGDQQIPVMLRTRNNLIQSPQDMQNLYVSSSSGELVPISSISEIVEEGVSAELERQAQRRAIEVDADLPEDLPMSEAVEQLRAIADEVLPDSMGLVFLGEAATFEDTSQEIAMTYILAFLIVLLVLAAQFESLNSAVVVMLTVPFGIAAAIYALFLTGTSMNIYSQIGLVMLIGLLAKNSVLLVEFADQLRDRGMKVREAIEEAALIRLRPIMMTLVSTILGGLPLILSSGAGAEARNSIGWVVFGGLGLATLFTLYLTPVLYLWLARFTKPRADESARLENEMQQARENGH